MMRRLLFVACLFVGLSSWANPQTIRFVTTKEWKAARWYLVGQWVAPNRIRWLGGGETSAKFTKPSCTAEQGIGQLVRLGAKGVVQTLEVLEKETFVAIELSPAVARERFEFRSPQFGSDSSCKAEASISYNWSGKRGDFRPFLALTAQNNRTLDMFYSLSLPKRKGLGWIFSSTYRWGCPKRSFPMRRAVLKVSSWHRWLCLAGSG